MMYTIFYSWQSDLPNKFNRGFIESCLKKSLSNIERSDDFIVELNLDRDTIGESGTPDIVSTIFKKIANAHLFICDISLINKDSISKKSPNPNVLLELGYAAHALSWENVICIFNSSFGRVEDLPFDLKLRRPIIYQYSDVDEKDKDMLIKHMEAAIKAAAPEVAEEKKKVKRAFTTESSAALKIAIEKPDHWEYRLTEALLLDRFELFNQKYLDVKKGVIFAKKRHIKALDFFSVFENEINSIELNNEGLNVLVTKDLKIAFGPPGIEGDAIAILNVINKIFKLLDNFLEWEIMIRSISTTERLEEIRLSMLDFCDNVIAEFNSLPSQFRKVYTNPKSKQVHTISLNLDSAFNAEKALSLMKKYKSNPSMLLEE